MSNEAIYINNNGTLPPHPYGPRKIIHVDMDAFYASIEILDNPDLASLPVVVGGSPNSRGVVCTSNYIARKFGIRSAMACSVAYRLCPSAVFLPPRFERYKEISLKIRHIFNQYTNLVEPLSLDEAYLDVTNSESGLFASQIAKRIKDQVYAETGLTCSAGVAPNKLIAKIASDYNKPNGIKVVTPDEIAKFMFDLPVRKIHGIGPATEKRLLELGIKKCADVLNVPAEELRLKIGSWADWLGNAAQGIDHRKVEIDWERKSFGREDTFAKDILDVCMLEEELSKLTAQVARDLKRAQTKARTFTLKLKYYDFECITRSKTIPEPLDDSESIFPIVRELLRTKTLAGQKRVRLIGVSSSKLA